MRDSELLDELIADPTSRGYREQIDRGSMSELAAMLNTPDSSTGESRAHVLEQSPDAFVDWTQIAAVLRGYHEDEAVKAYAAGKWPTVAVYVPPEKLEAAGLTDAHLLAAKMNHEGTALGVPEDRHDEAFKVLAEIDADRVDALKQALPGDREAAEQARVKAIIDDLARRERRQMDEARISRLVYAALERPS